MKQEMDTTKFIRAALDHGAASLDKATVRKLEAARKAAVAAMPAHTAETAPVPAGAGRHFTVHLHGQRLWATMLAMLGAVLVLYILLHSMRQNGEALETDTLLLASDLPPEAYADKGFDTWLEQTSRR